MHVEKKQHAFVNKQQYTVADALHHGLRTPNEGINQINLKILG